MLFNDEHVNWSQLEAALAEMKLPQREHERDRVILIESDAGVYYQNYYHAMVAINRAGGFVGIVSEDDDSEEGAAEE